MTLALQEINDLIDITSLQPLNTPKRGSEINYISLPSDPYELGDQLKLFYFEKKIGENDNPQLNEQTIAITDKLLEYECFTTIQHPNLTSITKDLLLD